MSEWGGACFRCGHPAGYHGASFCQVQAGAERKRPCDCSGYAGTAAAERERSAREERQAIRRVILQLDHDFALHESSISDMDQWGESEMDAAQSMVAGVLSLLNARDELPSEDRAE